MRLTARRAGERRDTVSSLELQRSVRARRAERRERFDGARSVEVEEADDLPQHLRLVTRVEEQIRVVEREADDLLHA